MTGLFGKISSIEPRHDITQDLINKCRRHLLSHGNLAQIIIGWFAVRVNSKCRSVTERAPLHQHCRTFSQTFSRSPRLRRRRSQPQAVVGSTKREMILIGTKELSLLQSTRSRATPGEPLSGYSLRMLVECASSHIALKTILNLGKTYKHVGLTCQETVSKQEKFFGQSRESDARPLGQEASTLNTRQRGRSR